MKLLAPLLRKQSCLLYNISDFCFLYIMLIGCFAMVLFFNNFFFYRYYLKFKTHTIRSPLLHFAVGATRVVDEAAVAAHAVPVYDEPAVEVQAVVVRVAGVAGCHTLLVLYIIHNIDIYRIS